MSDPCANPPGHEAPLTSGGEFTSSDLTKEKRSLSASPLGANVSSRIVQAESVSDSASAAMIGRMDHLHVTPINAPLFCGFRGTFPSCSSCPTKRAGHRPPKLKH